MKKIVFLFFLATKSFAQLPPVFEPDSSDLILRSDFGRKIISDLNTNIKEDSALKFVNDFSAKFNQNFNSGIQYKLIIEKNIDDWEMDLFENKKKQLSFLNSKASVISPSLFSFVKNEIEFNYWHYIFAYPIIRGNSDQKLRRVISLPLIMTEEFPSKSLSNNELMLNKSFRNLLYFYISYQNSAIRKFEKYTDQLQGTNDKAQFAINELKGNTLDYALGDILLRHQSMVNGVMSKNIISQINDLLLQDYFKNDILPEILNRDLTKIKEKDKKSDENLKSNYVELIDLDGKKFDFSKYKGQVVYVDFWASWCGPCRKEMPYSKSMHESLTQKEKKDIVFLYISIDNNDQTWKDAVKQLGLENFENAFSPGEWASAVVQKYKINGIPRYMIIDKTGKIVNLDATRPSDPNTIETLKNLAK